MSGTPRVLTAACFILILSTIITASSSTETTSEAPTWSYRTQAISPFNVKDYHKKNVASLPDLKKLITDNPAFVGLLKKSKQSPKLELKLLQWAELVGEIAAIDEQVKRYTETMDKLEAFTLEEYLEWCLSHDPGAIQGLMKKIHALVVPIFKEYGLLQLIHQFLQTDTKVCDLQMSPHQLLYSIYSTIELTEIKGFALMQFSWALLRSYGRGKFTQEAILVRETYIDRTTKTAAAATSVLTHASRNLYRCTPSSTDSYAEVTKLLQGYVENEVDMNPDGTCRNTCVEYSNTARYGCYDDQYCAKQPPCQGRIYNCQFIESDMYVCPARSSSFRRYEWIKYESGKSFGRVGGCWLGTTEVESWHRWFVHCSYCMCLCDDASYDSHRYFSLREATSDINNNKVVTGIRLVKYRRVFHIQIYEGTLMERGLVDASEEVDVEKFDPKDYHVVVNDDYHKLDHDSRAINIDELDSPTGYVLTGARFRRVGSHLNFEIRCTPFNFTTGKLTPEKSYWSSGSNNWRSRVSLYSPDVPTRTSIPDEVKYQNNQYIEFTHTDFSKDAAQTTVPFIDVQPVFPSKALETEGATLNSGAGLYHRGTWGSGGFLGFKLRTYDYSNHVTAKPPPKE